MRAIKRYKKKPKRRAPKGYYYQNVKWTTKSGKVHHGYYLYQKMPYQQKDVREKRSPSLVGKDGRIGKNNIKNLNNYLNQINNDPTLSDAEKLTYTNEVKKEILDAKNFKYKLTIKSVESRISENKTERFILNLGYEPEQLADELDIDVDDLLDESNWEDNMFSLGDDAYEFEFKYTGEAYKKVIK